MILRKPYAFLIKHFKLIHLIMTVFIGILIYQTNTLLSFFNDFIGSTQTIVGLNVVETLFSSYSYILCMGVVLTSLIIFILMSFKEKPRVYYALNIVGYILLIVLYIYAGNTIEGMQKNILDERLVRAVRDFLNIAFIFQLYSIVISFIRTIGLDVKKFDFKDDVDDLGLTDLDNEEFEVNIEFDSQTLKRKIRRGYHNVRYYFVENRLMLIIVGTLLVFVIGIGLYRGLKDDTVVYQMNQPFSPIGYNMIVESAYVTSTDVRLNKISIDTSLVVVKFKIKTLNKTEKFIFGKLALQIGDNKYYHNIKNRSYVSDLGVAYVGQTLTDEYGDYILVYEIPSNLKNNKMDLVYTEQIVSGMFKDKTDDIKIPLVVTDLDVKKDDEYINYNQNYIVGSGLLKGYEFKVNNIELNSNFKINYNACVKSNECYTYYEYLSPSLSGISDKAILKLNMNLTIPKDGSIRNISDLITKFGTVEYVVNGVSKSTSITKKIDTTRKDNNNYFETKKEVLNSDDITLVLKVRNDIFKFKIK